MAADDMTSRERALKAAFTAWLARDPYPPPNKWERMLMDAVYEAGFDAGAVYQAAQDRATLQACVEALEAIAWGPPTNGKAWAERTRAAINQARAVLGPTNNE